MVLPILEELIAVCFLGLVGYLGYRLIKLFTTGGKNVK